MSAGPVPALTGTHPQSRTLERGPSHRPGEILGELGIVHRRLRSVTVVSATDVLALHLDRTAFERLHGEHPYFRALVGQAMLRKST